jgi:ribose transport system substrate-binding protein
LRILVTPQSVVASFWVTVKAGADSAGKELGVEVIWKGPPTEADVNNQISILEDYINQRIDAIVLAALDTKALIPVVRNAVSKNIPVITIDSGIDSDEPKSFIATNNVLGANMAAKVLAQLIGYKGNVALIPFFPGTSTSIERERGFREEIAKYPDIKLVTVQYSQNDMAIAMAVTENMLTSFPDIDGIFAANEPGVIGASQAVSARGLSGKVKIVGFDAAENEIDALKKNIVQALVVQNPFKMGYLGVKSAVDVINGKEIPKRVDTGVTVVTMENFYNEEIQKLLYPIKSLSKSVSLKE